MMTPYGFMVAMPRVRPRKRRRFGRGRTVVLARDSKMAAQSERTSMIKRIRVEPISTYLERYRKGGVAHPVTIANGFAYLSGLPPFDPQSGEIKPQPFERQCELVLEQLKHCLEAVGSSLSQVIKCNVYCVPGPAHFSTFNAVYDRYFPKDAPSRIFMFIHSWPGPFDLELDCVATV
jgi:2-iminobutanoate/2-iminopropanoate deaminase